MRKGMRGPHMEWSVRSELAKTIQGAVGDVVMVMAWIECVGSAAEGMGI